MARTILGVTIAEAKSITKRWAALYLPEEAHGLSDKARKVRGIAISADFGCKRQLVLDLMSAVLGEDLGSIGSEGGALPLMRGVMLVPVMNENEHDYPMNKPALAREHSLSMLRIDGTNGNRFPAVIGEFRIATDEEIEKFFNECPVGA